MRKLHLPDDSLALRAVTLGQLALQKEIKKARKADEGLEMDTSEHDELEACSKDLLQQLGYVAPKKKSQGGAEVTRDPRQLEAVLGKAAFPQCQACGRRFGVPAGEKAMRRCPDCGSPHAIASDANGMIIMEKRLVEPPDEIRALMIRAKDKDAKPLSPLEKKRLEKWVKENPDHTTNAEEILRGERVADPAVPGSGNPLEIICETYVQNGCSGFDSVDTEGKAGPCPKCGQLYKVMLEEGKVFVRPWSDLDTELEEGQGS